MSRRVVAPPVATPRRESSVNDDLAEKSLRRRRSHSANTSGVDLFQTPSRETLTSVARRVTDTPSGDHSFNSSRRPSGIRSSRIEEPADFNEWMRLIRQNRVKGLNAFTIHLIDYFHDMVSHDGGANQDEIMNFQKATYTLGGCVKVYKTRIASVANDTSKLLNGIVDGNPIADDDGENGTAERAGDSDDSDVDDGEDYGDQAEKARKQRLNRKQRKSKANSYLASSEKLMIDTDELSTSIDPLFRKMCADFDKRGAGGMLQYSLKQDRNGRFLLDAETEADGNQHNEDEQEAEAQPRTILPESFTNAPLGTIAEEDEEEDEAREPEREVKEDAMETEPETDTVGKVFSQTSPDDSVVKDELIEKVDMAHMNLQYFLNLKLDDLEICPSIQLIIDAIKNPEEGATTLAKDVEAWVSDASPMADDIGEADGFAGGEDNVDDPYGVIDGHGADGATEINDNFESSLLSVAVPPSRNWMDSELFRKVDEQIGNWAGPEHWKVTRLRSRAANDAIDLTGIQKPARAPKPAKAPMTIDFLHPQVSADMVLLQGKAINLAGAFLDTDKNFLLPDDMGVSVKQIVALETRPKTGAAPAFLRQRRHVTGVHNGTFTTEDDYDAARMVWNQLDNEIGAENDHNASQGHISGGYDADFFMGQDDIAGNAFTGLSQSPMSRLHELAGSRGDQLNFARTAKRVDVRLLKENIWKAVDKPSEAPHTLNEVIGETLPNYSESQRANLSPSMYFISLLHLANEHSLHLENTPGYADIQISAN